MGAAIGLREDFGSADLRVLARSSKDANQARRLLALAVIYDGGWRRRRRPGPAGSACRSSAIGCGASTQAVWGMINAKAPGKPPKLSADQRAALAAIVERGPIPAIHGVVRWRLIDLMQWVWEEFVISLSEATMSRELNALGYRKISARPRHHAQNEFAIEAFKKTSPPSWRRSGRASRPAPR